MALILKEPGAELTLRTAPVYQWLVLEYSNFGSTTPQYRMAFKDAPNHVVVYTPDGGFGCHGEPEHIQKVNSYKNVRPLKKGESFTVEGIA